MQPERNLEPDERMYPIEDAPAMVKHDITYNGFAYIDSVADAVDIHKQALIAHHEGRFNDSQKLFEDYAIAVLGNMEACYE